MRRALALAALVLLAGVLPATQWAALPGANGRIAFTRDNIAYTIAPDGRDERRVSALQASGPEWSPDGTRLAFNSLSGSGGLFVANADGSGRRRISRNWATSAEEVLVTGGAQQGISLCARSYAGHGSVVVMEDPTFPGAVDAFQTAGARILPIPVYESGADVGLVERTVAEHRVRAAYLMPTFHNPTGSVMPDQARRVLVRFVRAAELPIVEDNTLSELVLGTPPPPSLAAYSRNASIVSVGSLSKVYWAGLRVGWVRAPRSTIVQLGRLKAVADLGTSLPSQAMAVNLLARSEHVLALRRRELEARMTLLEELLRRHMPEWTWRRPQGGLSLWVRLPEGSATELTQSAHRRGVSIAPGSLMSITGRFDEFVRLSFDHEEAALEKGIRRLAAAWRTYRRALARTQSSRLHVVV